MSVVEKATRKNLHTRGSIPTQYIYKKKETRQLTNEFARRELQTLNYNFCIEKL